MKGILKAILTILLILAFGAAVNCVCNGATLTFNWADLGLQTRYLSNRVFYVTPILAPFASGDINITGDRKNYTNDSTASCTATSVVSGAYTVELTGPYAQTKLTIWVPVTNATLTVSTLITSPTNLPTAGSVAWSSASSDIRYVRHTNGMLASPTNFFSDNVVAGTNIVVEYSNHWIRISGASVAAGTFGLSNATDVVTFGTKLVDGHVLTWSTNHGQWTNAVSTGGTGGATNGIWGAAVTTSTNFAKTFTMGSSNNLQTYTFGVSNMVIGSTNWVTTNTAKLTLGAGTVTVTSNNAGTYTITGLPADPVAEIRMHFTCC